MNAVQDTTAIPSAQQAPNEAWMAAYVAWDEAKATEVELLKALNDAVAAADADAPFPEALRINGVELKSERAIEKLDVPFDRKVELVATLREWRRVYDPALEWHQVREKDDAWGYFSTDPELDRLIDTSVPDLVGLGLKMRALIERIYCEYTYQTMDTPEFISELLSSGDMAKAGIARLYQDVLRLLGARPELTDAQPFDAEAWITAFNAISGHEITEDGPAYLEPLAFGADCPTDEDFRISDPVAVENYERAVEAMFPSPEAYEAHLTNFGRPRGRPFFAPQREALGWAWSHVPEEQARLEALWDQRLGRHQAGYVGQALWDELPAWQQKAVLRGVQS